MIPNKVTSRGVFLFSALYLILNTEFKKFYLSVTIYLPAQCIYHFVQVNCLINKCIVDGINMTN